LLWLSLEVLGQLDDLEVGLDADFFSICTIARATSKSFA